jgi:hypothetical protein
MPSESNGVDFKSVACVIAEIMTFKSDIGYAIKYGPSPGEGVTTHIEAYYSV